MAKNKTLPKDFENSLKEGDLSKLKAVFDKCNLDARGGFYKQTALAFDDCPDDLARWLVEQGLNISAADERGNTPLQSRAGSWQGRIGSLLTLGADVNYGDGEQGTALHWAAAAHHVANVKILLENGARVDALDKNSMTPLELALKRASNATIERMEKVAIRLLDAGASKRPSMLEYVTRIGTNFEFHRSNFNSETRASTSIALEHLYQLFNVPPVPRRNMHDGVSPIVAKAGRWEDQHQELWELLVPSSGAAKTIQGEVIRISGRIINELEGNGGVNWDSQFEQMLDAWLAHVQSGKQLPQPEFDEAIALVKEIKQRGGNSARLCELATAWVGLNPQPALLPQPAYDR